MKRRAALRLAIRALQRQRHVIAPEALIYERYGVRTAEHTRANAEYEKLSAAIAILEAEMKVS